MCTVLLLHRYTTPQSVSFTKAWHKITLNIQPAASLLVSVTSREPIVIHSMISHSLCRHQDNVNELLL